MVDASTQCHGTAVLMPRQKREYKRGNRFRTNTAIRAQPAARSRGGTLRRDQ